MVRTTKYQLALLSILSAACAPRPHRVAAVADDYALLLPESLPAGVTEFTLTNRGHVPHEMAIGRLRPGAGMQEMLIAAKQGLRLRDGPDHYLDGAPFGLLLAWPGQTSPGKLTVTLEKGQRYAVQCMLRDSLSAPAHAALGMLRVIQVP